MHSHIVMVSYTTYTDKDLVYASKYTKRLSPQDFASSFYALLHYTQTWRITKDRHGHHHLPTTSNNRGAYLHPTIFPNPSTMLALQNNIPIPSGYLIKDRNNPDGQWTVTVAYIQESKHMYPIICN